LKQEEIEKVIHVLTPILDVSFEWEVCLGEDEGFSGDFCVGVRREGVRRGKPVALAILFLRNLIFECFLRN